MNVTKRTLAVIALAAAAVMSATTVANADTRDSQPPQTSTNLVYPYSAAYPPGVLPLAAAPAVAILGLAPFGVL
ncbi:PhrC/PhrF family phosphatase-inhibitory pheromone [Streptomyces regalis]|uniref:Uncharacterized protein n=1 Tax=Streptomyces regalis TaxID=68262 RepID=A0A101JSZ7_9ACTN|nr:PhrC/PhrF family phosphatase-inhibitory pheromone [Streptomyces regalis]KUL32519.1 hypothetical protein ADL12_22950 [Streptomyces regalis]